MQINEIFGRLDDTLRFLKIMAGRRDEEKQAEGEGVRISIDFKNRKTVDSRIRLVPMAITDKHQGTAKHTRTHRTYGIIARYN